MNTQLSRTGLRGLGTLLPLAALTACSEAGDACALEDLDGIIGGTEVFVLRVDDDGFAPRAFKAQNKSDVTLTLINEGSTEAGFLVECRQTPNEDGCPQESCFPEAATIEPIAPGESVTVEFQLPEVEGLYSFRATSDGDRSGQFSLD